MRSTSRVSSRNEPGPDPFRRGNLSPDERGPRRPREGGASEPARPFAFGGEAARTMSAIPAIDRLNERMVRRLRDVIEPFARVKPQGRDRALHDPRLRRLAGRAGRVHQPQPLRLPPDEGRDPAPHRTRIRQPPGRRLLRRHGAQAPRRAREFTATEESLLGRLVRSADRRARRGLGPRSCRSGRSCARARPMPASPGSPSADEMVALTRFTIAPWPGYALDHRDPLSGRGPALDRAGARRQIA